MSIFNYKNSPNYKANVSNTCNFLSKSYQKSDYKDRYNSKDGNENSSVVTLTLNTKKKKKTKKKNHAIQFSFNQTYFSPAVLSSTQGIYKNAS